MTPTTYLSMGTVIEQLRSKKRQQKEQAEAPVTPKSTKNSVGENEFFEILCRLGEGSYGAVYKALDKRDGRLVAIKVLEMKRNQQAIEEALREEIDFMKGCDSDYIVRFKGIFPVDGRTWIAMEYCAAGSLADILEICGGTFAEPEIAAAMKGALLGLDYLHAHNKMHRDIKGANILINDRGECKLADFGVSREMKSSSERRFTMIGTPYWMAPEVLQPRKGYDTKADIWSVGITAYEMAKGSPPFFDLAPMRAIYKIPTMDPPKLPENEPWSSEFVDFLAQCLTKDPSLRPSAAALLQHPFVANANTDLLKMCVDRCFGLIEAFRQAEKEDADSEEKKVAEIAKRGVEERDLAKLVKIQTSVFERTLHSTSKQIVKTILLDKRKLPGDPRDSTTRDSASSTSQFGTHQFGTHQFDAGNSGTSVISELDIHLAMDSYKA